MEPNRPLTEGYEAERLSDAAVHCIGVVMALMAVPVLVVIAVLKRGDPSIVLATGIYGASLTAMLAASAIYNITGQHRWTKVLKRIDHSAIYFKIAGSFTPLVALTGAAGLPFLAGLWGAAIGGTSLKLIAPDKLRWLGLTLYLGMGWVGVLAGNGIFSALSPEASMLIALGGILYTVGVIFFLWEGLPYHTTIWHLFVLIASALVYSAILVELLREIDPAVLTEALSVTIP